MKPGEFVGADGRTYGVIQAIRIFHVPGGQSARVVCIEHPDFPLAVAALQSLIRPSLDPRSGRVMAMREAEREPWRTWVYASEHDWTRQS